MLKSLYQEVPSDQSNLQLTRCGPDLKFVKEEVVSTM